MDPALLSILLPLAGMVGAAASKGLDYLGKRNEQKRLARAEVLRNRQREREDSQEFVTGILATEIKTKEQLFAWLQEAQGTIANLLEQNRRCREEQAAQGRELAALRADVACIPALRAELADLRQRNASLKQELIESYARPDSLPPKH